MIDSRFCNGRPLASAEHGSTDANCVANQFSAPCLPLSSLLGAAVLEWARAERASWPAPATRSSFRAPAASASRHRQASRRAPAPPPPPCGNSCASCGFALCPLCKEDARALLDCAVKGEWPTIRAALDERPELLNYAPEAGEVPGGSERATHALLHFAARTGDEALVAALLALPGCQPRLQTRDGRTASAIAQEREHREVRGALRAAERRDAGGAPRGAHDHRARGLRRARRALGVGGGGAVGVQRGGARGGGGGGRGRSVGPEARRTVR